MGEPVSLIAAARAALGSGAWQQADVGFRAAAQQDDDPAAYEGLAQTAWWLDDAQTCLRAREQAYRRFRELGDDRGAARAAAALGYDSFLFGQGAGVARGWLGRAADLVETLPESSEHGWLAVRRAELALAVDRDPVAGRDEAERATAVGRRQSDGDLEVVGQALCGLAQIAMGDVPAGMARLDTAVAAAIGGDVVDLMWLGKICCWLIVACQETRDVARASDWCRRVEELCVERDLVPLFTVCRIQYAALQVAQGTWPEAERELTSVVAVLERSRRTSRLEAVVQLGELRRRQGRLVEAEALLRQAEFSPVSIVGRALIRLARGDAAGAWGAVSALLRDVPQAHRLDRVGVLAAAVVTAVAADDVGAARDAATELRETAEMVGTEALLGEASAADAQLSEAPAAVRCWYDAVRHFHAAGLRYDEAECRLNLAEALATSGDRAAADEQARAALEAFTELDAPAELSRARRLMSISTAGASPITARETQVLRLVAQGLSNVEIARELVVSEHTVHRHVANILAKLGQPSRAAATAYALTTGVI